MTRVLHVVNSDRAPWSTLAACAALQRAEKQASRSMEILLHGETPGAPRAAQAGIIQSGAGSSFLKKRRRADLTVAWDDGSYRDLTKQAHAASIVRPQAPIAMNVRLIDQRAPQNIRRDLKLPESSPVVALLADPCDPQHSLMFASLLVAMSLAGFPATGVMMNGSPNDTVLEAMHSAGRGATLVVRCLPPWVILPACDCAIALDAVPFSSPIGQDLARWGAATGAPVLSPSTGQCDERTVGGPSRRRFDLSRQLLATLKAQSNRTRCATSITREAETRFDRWLQLFQTQLEEMPAGHLGVG